MKASEEARRSTLAAVIGAPVGHSLSPAMHNSAFGHAGRRWHYFASDVDTVSLPGVIEAVRALPFGGLSVTTPLKEAVIEHLDEISPESECLRSVNCITVRDGRLSGDITDGRGCVDALREAGVELAASHVALFGAGATARAIASAICAEGAVVTVLNRSRDRAERLCELITSMVPDASVSVADVAGRAAREVVRSADVVLNATTVGMNSAPGEASLVADDSLGEGQTVFDAVYQPLETPLLRAARAGGARTVDGLWMLVHQAIHQQVSWFGEEGLDRRAMAGLMRAAAERELALRHR